LITATEATCGACHTRRPASEFRRDSNRSTGIYNLCRSCENARRRSYRAKNRDATNARRRANYVPKWDGHCANCGTKLGTRQRLYCGQNCKAKAQHLRQKYDLSLDAFMDLVARQDASCAICRTPVTEGGGGVVDHCHDSGKVRGLLCRKCNSGLGMFRDQPALLRQALAYLEEQDF
jgi:hypothetical protein